MIMSAYGLMPKAYRLTIGLSDCEAIGKYGPRYKGPNQYQLIVHFLNKAYKKIQYGLEKTKKYGMNMVAAFSLMDEPTESIEV